MTFAFPERSVPFPTDVSVPVLASHRARRVLTQALSARAQDPLLSAPLNGGALRLGPRVSSEGHRAGTACALPAPPPRPLAPHKHPGNTCRMRESR